MRLGPFAALPDPARNTDFLRLPETVECRIKAEIFYPNEDFMSGVCIYPHLFGQAASDDDPCRRLAVARPAPIVYNARGSTLVGAG